MRGEKYRLWTPGQTEVCPHTAAMTHLPTAKLAAIMRAQILNDHKLPGSHTRSLRCQRPPKTSERTSDGQPENFVGRLRKIHTCLNI